MANAEEDETATTTHLKWPSFSNIHRLVANNGIPVENVIVLEKIDGSNLGVEVDRDGLVALHGRNTLLWYKGMEQPPYNRKYGCVAGTLDPIAAYIPRLVNFFKSLESVLSSSIVVYGEWYRDREHKAAAPCWYPFGYAFRAEDVHYNTMTRDLYASFVQHDLHPPRILFSGGPITEAVKTLHPMMMEPPSEQFEGVFITREGISGTQYCAKWKTGNFEEQPSWVIQEATYPDALDSFIAELRSVYDTRTKTGPQREQLKRATPPVPFKHQKQVALAFQSVLSKSPVTSEDIRDMDREDRSKELKRLAEETMNDIQEQFKSVGVDVPKAIHKLVGQFVGKQVMRPK